MEWARLAVDLAGHIAWPGAILIIALVFKSQIQGILNPEDVDSVEAGTSGVKINRRRISDELSAASKAIDADARTDNSSPEPEVSSRLERMSAIAAIDPAAAVFASAASFESILRGRLHELGLVPAGRGPGPGFRPLGELLKIARAHGLLTRNQADGAVRLNRVRNEIAHEYIHVEMEEEQALEFCRLAGGLEEAVLFNTPVER